MKLSNMRYKTFAWPHNPRVYSIQFQRKMAVNKIPFGRYALQNLGLTRRVMRGEGEFVGEGAYQDFKKLASLFYEETPGMLVHPLWDTAQAWFVDLKLEQEPREDYVKYSFEFWEDYPGAATELKETAVQVQSSGTVSAETASDGEVWHTVVKGESLWAIAAHYGVTVAELVDWNPQIKNPNLIYVGQKVRVG